MSDEVADQLEALSEHLAALVAAAAAIWQEYQECGAGRVAASMYDPVEAALADLAPRLAPAGPLGDELRTAVGAEVRQAADLARRCARSPQGLSFITGEAGLIPRRDLMAAFDRVLASLDQRTRELRQQAERLRHGN